MSGAPRGFGGAGDRAGAGAGALSVGARIRALRVARELSLSALAAQAGIGKGSLSELESGRRNPTLDTLYAVARPLGVPLAALLDEHDGARIGDVGMAATRIRVLCEPQRTTEVYLLRFAPGAVRSSGAHADGVVEQITVLTGTLRMSWGARERDLGPTEHLTFAADVPHAYRAVGDQPVEVVDVIVTPVDLRG